MSSSVGTAQQAVPNGPISSVNRPPVYSTHDWSVTPAFTDNLREAWADVKSPGDGRTYKVGTVEIRDNRDISLPQFSGHDIFREPSSLPQLSTGSTSASFQVVVVQITDDASQSISTVQGPTGPRAAQVYFYGFEPTQPTSTHTNARGISVWPAADPEDARIAICGEVFDARIPLSQVPSGWSAANPNTSSGFVAVYDGNLQLLWTHQLFGANAEGGCAVTDVSMRRENLADGQTPIDVVTFCGISSHGDAGAGTPLEPRFAFLEPSGFCSSGSTVQGAAGTQWDGFVGRTYRSAGLTPPDFLSMVSGPGRDGLFGLAEMDEHRFAVVGSSLRLTSMTGPAFPFTFEDGTAMMPLPPTPFEVGTVLVFDADQTRSSGLLELESSRRVGGAGGTDRTACRDVAVGFRAFANGGSPLHALHLCGSTNDASLASSFAGPAPTRAHGDVGGGFDGFVASLMDVVGGVLPWSACFSGITGIDLYTGVQLWNEFPDHFTVVGSYEHSAANSDVLAESFLLDTAPGFPTASPASLQIRPVRRSIVGNGFAAVGDDHSAVMGFVNATASGWYGASDPLGDPAGGGVSVAPNGRVNLVGATNSSSYPAIAGGRGPDMFAGSARLPDAIRTVFDLVPWLVGKTDGLGDPIPGGLPSGFTGGTTPACALSSFGIRVGGLAPGLQVPVVQRMFVDYEGDESFLAASIFVSRPPASLGFGLGAVLQLALPNTTAPVVLLPEALELWTTHATATFVLGSGIGNESMRINLGTVPIGVDVAAQVLVILAAPQVPPGPCGGSPTSITMVASPAIWIDN